MIKIPRSFRAIPYGHGYRAALLGILGVTAAAMPAGVPGDPVANAAHKDTEFSRPLVFQDLLGHSVRLGPDNGQITALHFWATWCPPCLQELPSVDRLATDYAGKGLSVTAVSEDDNGEYVVPPFIARRQALAHVHQMLLDADKQTGRSLGIDILPTTILLDRQGREITRFEGAREWDSPEMRAALDKVLAAVQ